MGGGVVRQELVCVVSGGGCEMKVKRLEGWRWSKVKVKVKVGSLGLWASSSPSGLPRSGLAVWGLGTS